MNPRALHGWQLAFRHLALEIRAGALRIRLTARQKRSRSIVELREASSAPGSL